MQHLRRKAWVGPLLAVFFAAVQSRQVSSVDLGDLHLEVPGFESSAPTAPPPAEPAAKRSLGGRLRTSLEEFIPEGLAASLSPPPPPKDIPQETQVEDDGEGCVDKIGIASSGTSPLYQCAYDRRKCYGYEGHDGGGYCAGFVPYPMLMSPAEQQSIDSDAKRAMAIHDWVGSSPHCLTAWKAYACAYNYDKCLPDGEMDTTSAAPSCQALCEGVGQHCDVGQLLKTTKRFLGEIRYTRLSRALYCPNYMGTGCNYRFPNGILGAGLWPGKPWDADEIDEDIDYEDLKEL